MRTRRPAPPLPLRAFGSRTAISSAQKTSPRGGQPKGGTESRPSQETAPYPPRSLGTFRLEKLKSPESGEE